jgi:hypothetical protein
MKFISKAAGTLLMVAVIFFIVFLYRNLRDQNPGYKADLKIISVEKSPLSAGFAAVKITPDIPDRWVDANNDAIYDPRDGDTYTDGNGNGKFDAYWLAGFGNGRAANGIHDDLWARTMVLDDGKSRLAIVSIDAIGLMNNEIIELREMIPSSAEITYSIIASTHSHEVPDLLGLWGDRVFKTGVNREYIGFVKNQIVKSIEAAVSALKPAVLEISEDLTGASPLVTDSRIPVVTDSGLRIIRAADRQTGATLGTLIAWANHPETLWSRNLMVTSDFPHFFREAFEKGVYKGDSLVKPGAGGIAVYINGAIGGLMTTDPELVIEDPFTGKEYKEPSFEKAEALGKSLAIIALSAAERPSAKFDSAGISMVVRSVIMPIDNRNFRLGSAVGVFNRGTSGWMKMKSELAVLNIGPVSIATLPGEVYPELINGGIEAPDGRDFLIEPAEVPSVRDMMTGRYKFVFGLANDEIGYIIPKSQWDVKEPLAYGMKEAQYGEENSLGPETGPLLHGSLKEMFSELNQAK